MIKTKNNTKSRIVRFAATLVVTLFVVAFSIPFTANTAGAWSVEGAWDSVQDWAQSGDNPNEVVSFSDFKGGLSAPTGDGLDQTLKQTSSARQFVINAVNFVLGFLGLAAVVVIVYAGILYVTAAGNEDNTGKAKNAIKYAVIGIILIAASYAIVNTVINFAATGQSDRTAGSNDPALHGSSGNNIAGTNSAQGRVYSLGAVEIQSAMNEIENAYKTLVGISAVFTRIRNIEPPVKINQYRVFLGDITNYVTQIKNNTAALSETHLAAQQLLNEYFGRFASMSDETLESRYPEKSDGGKKLHQDVMAKLILVLTAPPERDFENTLEKLVGPLDEITNNIVQPTAETETTGRLQIVWKILGPAANDTQASDPSITNLVDPQELQKAFAGIDPSITVGQLFVEAFNKIKALNTITIVSLQSMPDESAAGSENTASNTKTFVDAMQSLNRLLIVVKNIKFVSANISANISTGNAPLIVELSGLGSRDPTGATIPDDNYSWDQDGDGDEGTSREDVICSGNRGPVVSCTYTQPGTYIVRLQVKSVDEGQVSDGLATYAVTIKPSLATIGLTAQIVGGSEVEVLREYTKDENGQKRLTLDKTEYHITTDEGARGVQFDASQSKGANDSELSYFVWKFNDGMTDAKGAKPEPHKYKKGRYPMTLEVTDKAGRKDRMSITVFVNSLAARIIPQKTEAAKDELIEFDGTMSHSDSGPINSYTWKIFAENGANPESENSCLNGDITDKTACVDILSEEGAPRLQAKFKNPGKYKVTLLVTDGGTITESAEISLRVKSQKPRGVINMRACPDDCPVPSDPTIIDFDSAGSFDPDVDDQLTYTWEIYNTVGDKLDAGPSTYQILPLNAQQSATNPKLEGPDVKQLRLKFTRIGKYKIVLRINDQYEDPIRQQSLVEKFFEVKSTIGIEWAPTMKSVAQLVDNRASITFSGTISNAESAELDFGDGETKDLIITNAKTQFSETHIYDNAKEYVVTLTAKSGANGENSISKRVVVAPGNEPRAVIRVFESDTEVVVPDTAGQAAQSALEINRGVRLTFDARQSITSSGSQSQSALNYSWDFGDGETSTKEVVTHTYKDLTAEGATTFVSLTISEKNNPAKIDTQRFPLRVISSKPKLTALTLEKKSSGNETPVSVLVRAEGARDVDGRVTNYQFWYYHPDTPDERFNVLDTASNQAELTVETYGDAGKENEFIFCVALTDSDNTTANCNELIDENRRPRLQVKNGPNKTPTASFEVQPSTTVRVGEEVTFISSSVDDDGEVKSYVWDVEGDGFQNNNPTDSPIITHTYAKKSPTAGYKVKLKVIDDKNATGYSREIPVFVTTPSNAPRANFRYEADPNIPLRMRFFDASTPDQQNQAKLAEWKWDFDLSQEFGCSNDSKPVYCNGDKTDDIDSSDQYPIFDFPTTGRYQVKLTVTDNYDSEAEIVQFIDVRGGAAGATDAGVARPRNQSAQADLKAFYDNRFSTFETDKKVLHVPANACAADVAFYWGDSRANDVPAFKLDKNLYHDANGNGNRADDYLDVGVMNECLLNGVRKNNCTVLSFQRFDQQTSPRGSGQFETEVSMLMQSAAGGTGTIIDKDSVKIVFDKTNNPATELTAAQCNQGGNNLSGSLFNLDISMNTLVYMLMAGAVSVLVYLGVTSFGPRKVG